MSTLYKELSFYKYDPSLHWIHQEDEDLCLVNKGLLKRASCFVFGIRSPIVQQQQFHLVLLGKEVARRIFQDIAYAAVHTSSVDKWDKTRRRFKQEIDLLLTQLEQKSGTLFKSCLEKVPYLLSSFSQKGSDKGSIVPYFMMEETPLQRKTILEEITQLKELLGERGFPVGKTVCKERPITVYATKKGKDKIAFHLYSESTPLSSLQISLETKGNRRLLFTPLCFPWGKDGGEYLSLSLLSLPQDPSLLMKMYQIGVEVLAKYQLPWLEKRNSPLEDELGVLEENIGFIPYEKFAVTQKPVDETTPLRQSFLKSPVNVNEVSDCSVTQWVLPLEALFEKPIFMPHSLDVVASPLTWSQLIGDNPILDLGKSFFTR